MRIRSLSPNRDILVPLILTGGLDEVTVALSWLVRTKSMALVGFTGFLLITNNVEPIKMSALGSTY